MQASCNETIYAERTRKAVYKHGKKYDNNSNVFSKSNIMAVNF
jgi:hypothetical protein